MSDAQPGLSPDLLDLSPVCPPAGRSALPMAGGGGAERSDAARNRAALLDAARRLLDADGIDALSMERLAAAAGVGKGTVYRRFGSREGLMAALLDFTESAWQAAVISGPSPLGPGAPPLERLLAFGASRVEINLQHADLIRAAGHWGTRSIAAYSFVETHVRYLLQSMDVEGDLPLLAVALLAPLEVPILIQQHRIDRFPIERIQANWADLVRRVVGPQSSQGAPTPVGLG